MTDLAEKYAKIFKVLSHPVRLKILALCLLNEKTSRELREKLGLSKPLLIAHLRKLVNVGYLTYRVKVDEERGIVRKYYKTSENFKIVFSRENLKKILDEIV